MRLIYAAFVLLLVVMTSAQCQQTAEDWFNKQTMPITKGDVAADWEDIHESYRQVHGTYIQAVIALSNLLYIDPSRTSYEDFDKRRQAAKRSLDAMERTGQVLADKTEPLLHLEVQSSANRPSEEGSRLKVMAEKGPVVSCESNTGEVIKRLARMGRENPAKAAQAKKAIEKLMGTSRSEYELNMQQAQTYTDLANSANNVQLTCGFAAFVGGIIATGGGTMVVGGSSGLFSLTTPGTVALTPKLVFDATSTVLGLSGTLLSYINENDKIVYGGEKNRISMPVLETTNRFLPLLGIGFSENKKDIVSNILGLISANLDFANTEINLEMDPQSNEMTVKEKPLPPDALKPESNLPPLAPGHYLTEPGTGDPIEIKPGDGRFQEVMQTINSLLSSENQADLEDIGPSAVPPKQTNQNNQPAFQGLARVFATSGGNLFINRGNISGRDPLGFMNCLCSNAGYAAFGVGCSYEPNPAGDCVWGNWGVNRGPLPNVSDFKNNSCAVSYGITEMRTNKTPLEPIASGVILKESEQIQTTGNTILTMPDGSMLLANPYSALTLTRSSSGKILVNIQQGGARIISPAGGPSGVEVKLGDKKIRPKGTEYTVQWDGKAGSVAVFEGSVTVTNETNANVTLPEVSIDAGWKLDTSTGMISPYNLSTDEGGLFEGIPLRDLILDDSDQEPYGEYKAAFSNGKIPEGWIWQDPGNDAKIETPENGTLRATVPDGNEFWDARTQAPRLLHKVTGDFDLEGELFLKSNGTDVAVSEFLMYSPGSNLGYLAKQMNPDGLGAHYRVLGGGWLHIQGINKLLLLNEKLTDSPNAPDTPVRFRLIRHGNIWKSYWSPDGVNWNISTRQEIVAPETVWVGWLFKRNAYDGLRSEPAITTLRDVWLETAPNGSMKDSDWDLVQGAGKVQADNATVHMELDGSSLGTLYAFKGGRLEGDFDAVVRFQAENWTRLPGESRQIGLSADSLDIKTLAFIGIQEKDNVPERYMTDLGINERFGQYQWKDTSDFGGYLRILRQKGNFSTYYWNQGQWVRLDKFGSGFFDPVYIRMWISNRDEAKINARLSVDYAVEQIVTGEAVGKNSAVPAGTQTHEATLSPGWDVFNEPLSSGTVQWTTLDDGNLNITFELNDASPNHRYIAGAHFFDPGSSSQMPGVCQFGGSKIGCDRGPLIREDITAIALGAWDFGYLDTNGNGYGKAQLNLAPPAGTYYVQFTVRIGDQCNPSSGITSGCAACYRTGTKMSQGLEKIIIPS